MSNYPPNQYGGDNYGQQGQGYYPPQQGYGGPPPQGYYPPEVSTPQHAAPAARCCIKSRPHHFYRYLATWR